MPGNANKPSALASLEPASEFLAIALEKCPYSRYKLQWMWADAGIWHRATEWDPFRWSKWASISETIRDLHGYITKDRPVEMDFKACGHQWRRVYTNAAQAIQHVQMEERTRIWKSAKTPFPFDPVLSESLAYVAGATYESGECHASIESWSCSKCKRSGLVMKGSVEHFGASSLILHIPHTFWGLVARPEKLAGLTDTCLIAFRGTDGPTGVADDTFEYRKEVPPEWRCPSCLVHSGWLGVWNKLEDQVVEALSSKACTKIALTGHSMGGVLATLGAWVLKHKYSFELSMVYTYESPRVGDLTFADAWDSNIAKTIPAFRITNAKDPWVNYPCRWGAYQHVLYEVHFEADGRYIVNPYHEESCGETETMDEIFNDPQIDHCDPPYAPNICGFSAQEDC